MHHVSAVKKKSRDILVLKLNQNPPIGSNYFSPKAGYIVAMQSVVSYVMDLENNNIASALQEIQD